MIMLQGTFQRICERSSACRIDKYLNYSQNWKLNFSRCKVFISSFGVYCLSKLAGFSKPNCD